MKAKRGGVDKVTFRETGPALSEQAITAFEGEYQLRLPADYRAFLLSHNGGVPEANYLKVKDNGVTIRIFVNSLYSLETTDKDRRLDEALMIHLSNDLPSQYLPIGQARIEDPGTGSHVRDFYLGLQGKSLGKVFVALQPPYEMQSMMAADDPDEMAAMTQRLFEEFCCVAAPSFATFLARLAPSS